MTVDVPGVPTSCLVEQFNSDNPSVLTLSLLQRIEETWGQPEYPVDWIPLPSQRRWEYETAIRLLDMPAGARILDAGGGCGYLSYIMSGGYDVLFNDRHDTYCQPSAPVQKIIGSLFTLLEQAKPYAAIVCVSVLEHILPKQRVAWFAKIHQLLRPGGVAVFTFEWHPNKVFAIGDGLTLTSQQLTELYASEQFYVAAQLISPTRANNSHGWLPLAVRLIRKP